MLWTLLLQTVSREHKREKNGTKSHKLLCFFFRLKMFNWLNLRAEVPAESAKDDWQSG